MGQKDIGIEAWWHHVNDEWIFSGEPRTWAYAGSTPEGPDFHLISIFEYYCPRHEEIHNRKVRGYTLEDLADALNSLPPEACDGVSLFLLSALATNSRESPSSTKRTQSAAAGHTATIKQSVGRWIPNEVAVPLLSPALDHRG